MRGTMGGRSSPGMGFGFGEVFKGVGGFLNLLARMAEEGTEEITGSGKREALGGKLGAVYGFNVRMGLGGTPVVEPFGNIQETESGVVVTEKREPLVDVLDEGNELVVIAELPGIAEEDVQVKVKDDVLEIAGSRKDRGYLKEVLLPTSIDPGGLKSSYRNGVLEIRIAKH